MQIHTLATSIFGAMVLAATGSRLPAQSANEVLWGVLPDGRGVKMFTLTNHHNTRVTVAEFGALLISIEAEDRSGKSENITLSYRNLDEAVSGGVYGSVIGRFANRIDQGGFTIDGKRHDLETVNPKTGVHIHGGKTGFHRQLWAGTCGLQARTNTAFVELNLTSDIGHEGYPGKVDVKVTYSLTEENILRIDYKGTTNQPTHLNLTNHAYFNLAGKGDVLDHTLGMICTERLEGDERKIPTGQILEVANSPFDFRTAKRIGKEIDQIEDGGYDHCYVVPGNTPIESRKVVTFAKLVEPTSGRVMEIATTMPGVQIYTANHLKGDPFPRWGGICFETQYFPDTPNKPEFPSSLLRPGEQYHHITEFRLGTE